VTLFSTILVVCGKVNFTNLSCYSRFNEKTYRRHFKAAFDFTGFNIELVSLAQGTGSGQSLLLVMDGSFISKSGKKTEGMDWYWNGCASRAEKGLEVSLVAVVDIATETAYALSAQQTLAQSEIPRDITRLEQYLYHLDAVRPQLRLCIAGEKKWSLRINCLTYGIWSSCSRKAKTTKNQAFTGSTVPETGKSGTVRVIKHPNQDNG